MESSLNVESSLWNSFSWCVNALFCVALEIRERSLDLLWFGFGARRANAAAAVCWYADNSTAP